MTIYFTSDTHFGHARINDLCERGFADVDAMNQGILDSFSHLKDDDILYHLGDVAMGGWKDTLPLMGQIRGYKVLLPGNHDVIHPMDRRSTRADVLEAFNSVFDEIIFGTLHFGGVALNHFPYFGDSQDEDRYDEWRPVAEDETVLLHGHVHTAWKFRNVHRSLFMVNVGWDIWRGPLTLGTVLTDPDRPPAPRL